MKTSHLIAFAVLQAIGCVLWAQRTTKNLYSITIPSVEKKIKSDHLKLGGENYKGESLSANNFYLVQNGKPYIPVMGEFHFSRYPAKYWDESIKKIKAGGVDIIATYIFWIMHEEEEGIFDWNGDKDLRHFVELCAANNMKLIIRIGPFCHGEIRNGGLPDWLLGRPLTIRSNDSLYLWYVERWYKQIAKQVEGLLFRDGGPIIGIQLENEYQHSASPWGLTYPGQPDDWTAAEQDRSITQAGVGVASARENSFNEYGDRHMRLLKQLAQQAGLDAPLFTATGWGYAAVIEKETIPVTGAYPYPTWAPLSLSPFFLYKDLHREPDYSPVRYVPEDYPNLTAEIGGGIMVRYERRPTVPPQSLDAVINRFLGSGSNGIGYYMYHGGSSPMGKYAFYSDEAYGYPKISYDFQAPIGEFGQIRNSYLRLKVLHHFIHAFGNELAPMSYFPTGFEGKIKPDNLQQLRYAIRTDGKSAFLFMLNFQDHIQSKDIPNVQFKINIAGQSLVLPQKPFTLKSNENVILPINQLLGNSRLLYATVQPLTRFTNNDTTYYVFFAVDGITPELLIDTKSTFATSEGAKVMELEGNRLVTVDAGSIPVLINLKNEKIQLLIINRQMAENSWVIGSKNTPRLIISKALVLDADNNIQLIQKGENQIAFDIFPKRNYVPKSNFGTVVNISHRSVFESYHITLPTVSSNVQIEKISDNKVNLKFLYELKPYVSDYYLTVDYVADVAMAFIDGKLVADDFYYGQPWTIGLKKFIDRSAKEMVLYFRPIYSDAKYLQDLPSSAIPDFKNNKTFLKLNSVNIAPEYRVNVSF
ncbi:MAG: beta-galactosidase [Bacteroidales bacterium]|nr:beta-galactosidase [Bacteroidales bacterium]